MQSLNSFRKPNTNMSFGMELECLIDGRIERDTHYGFWYATYDGSIMNRHQEQTSIEFVSQPLSPAWLKKEINRLAKKFTWEVNHSCGIHIHVSRKWLSERKARAIFDFYKSLDPADQEVLFGRCSNRYCRIDGWGRCRYAAVNNTNKATYEFRMFASGDAAWARYCVDMAEYLIRNANHLNIEAALAAHEYYKGRS